MTLLDVLLITALATAAPYWGDLYKVGIAWAAVHPAATCIAALCAIPLIIGWRKLHGV